MFKLEKESEALFEPLPEFIEGGAAKEDLSIFVDVTTETVKIDAGPVLEEVEVDVDSDSVVGVENTESVTGHFGVCMKVESASSVLMWFS